MLHLYPESVRLDLAQKGEIGSFHGFEVISPFAVRHEGSEVNMYLDLEEVSEIGGWGDPTQASAERGAEIMRRMEEFVISFIDRFQQMDPVVGKGSA